MDQSNEDSYEKRVNLRKLLKDFYSKKHLFVTAFLILVALTLSPLSPDTENLVSSSPNKIDSPLNTTSSDGGNSDSQNALQNGLQAYYRFDSPEVSRGNSLEFDGNDDYVDTGVRELVGPYSFNAWIKAYDENRNVIVNNRNGGGSDDVYFEYSDNSDCPSTPCLSFTVDDVGSVKSDIELESGRWYMVSGVLNDGLKVFVNGEYAGSDGAGNGDKEDSGGNYYVGTRPGDTSFNVFNGIIDDFRIYNRSLSKSEINSLYKQKPIPRDRLFLHYNLNEGPSSCDLTSGITCLEDKSVYGNDGTPENFDDNSFNTGSGWFNQTPLNRPSLKDSSGHDNLARFYGGNNGELKNFDFNDSSGWTEGVEGDSALKFDGNNDLVDIGNEFYVNEHTVSAWVNFDTLSQDGMVIGKGNEIYLWLNSNNGIRHEIQVDGSWQGDARIPESELSTDSWHFITATYNGGEDRIYLDGELVDTVSQTGDVENRTTRWTIGETLDGNSGRFFDGAIDKVRVHNKSLTEPEVESLYKGEEVRENLVGEWRFEEGNGDKAYDTSSLDSKGVLATSGAGFDLNSSVGVVDSDRFNFSDDFALSIWGDPEKEEIGTEENPGDSCKDILERNPSASDGVYWIAPSSSSAFEVYCDMSTQGGGWTLIWRNYGGPNANNPQSNADLWDSSNSDVVKPYSVAESFESEINIPAWENFTQKRGGEWLKTTRDYRNGELVRTKENDDNYGLDLYTPHEVILDLGAQQNYSELVNNVGNDCYQISDNVSMYLYQQGGEIFYGSSDHLIDFQLGFASEQDDCGLPSDRIMDGWAARHVISYQHTDSGRDTVRCQFECWDGDEDRTKEVVWAFREVEPDKSHVGRGASYGIFNGNKSGAFIGNVSIESQIYEKWQNMILNYDSGSLEFYLDGEKLDTAQYPWSIPRSKKYFNAGSNFQGKVDEVRIYNRSLSQQEVQQLSFQAN